jgi:cation:H+ antiporter
MLEILALAVGMGLMGFCAERVIVLSVRIADALQIPPLIIGVVLISMATSLPEITNSVASSVMGHGDINAGNALGSALTQITLIAALAVVTGGTIRGKRSDIMLLGGCTILATMLGVLAMEDGYISQLNATFLILSYLILIFIAQKYTVKEYFVQKLGTKHLRDIGLLFLFVGGVILGAFTVINSVIALSIGLGLPEYILAFFTVGIGTSLPELSIEITAIRRRRPSIAIGDMLGSNLTDTTLSLGLGPLLVPNVVSRNLVTITGMYVVVVTALVVWLFALREKIDKN